MSENVRTDMVENRAEHRLAVIQRLLDAGLSPSTLASVLPEFSDVIHDLTAHGDREPRRRLAATG